MTPEKRQEIVEDLQKFELEIIKTKGFDYSGVEDTLKNFKVNAETTGVTKYQVWLVYFMKHINAITNSIKNSPEKPTTKSELLSDRIMDARTYLGLLYCLLTEDIKK